MSLVCRGDSMTVDELIKVLQELSANGKGSYYVSAEDCEITEATVKEREECVELE